MFKSYVNELKRTHPNSCISKFRCDNAREYVKCDLEKFCVNSGITLDPSNPYTPKQNGKAERINRLLMERERALIKLTGIKL